MKNKIILAICALALNIGVFMVSFAPVSAVNVIDDACTIDPNSVICKNKDDSIQPIINTVVDTLLFVIGIIAVIMIVIGGIRYTLSAGESKAVNDAKNTILYAVIGLAVSFSAYAIVHWVLRLFP